MPPPPYAMRIEWLILAASSWYVVQALRPMEELRGGHTWQSASGSSQILHLGPGKDQRDTGRSQTPAPRSKSRLLTASLMAQWSGHLHPNTSSRNAASPDAFDADVAAVEKVKEDLTTTAEPLKAEVENFPRRRPFWTNVVFATLRTCLADLLIQWSEMRAMRPDSLGCAGGPVGDVPSACARGAVDWKRNLFFSSFGLLYDGLIAYLLEITVLMWLFPAAYRFAEESWAEKFEDVEGQKTLFLQVAWDNLIDYPLIYHPLFYALKSAFEGAGIATTWNTLRDNILTDCPRCWLLWIPGDTLAYSVPMFLRMVIVQLVGFLWAVVLSSSHGAEKVGIEDSTPACAGEADSAVLGQSEPLSVTTPPCAAG